MDETLKFFEEQKFAAVIRASDNNDAEAIAKALIDGGIRIIEITPNVTQATKLIETLAKNSQILVGYGSATDAEQAHRAINAGAKYVSSHYTDKNLFTVCKNNNAVVIQGAASPTEVMEAYNLGVDFVKIYPANFLGGPPYVKRLKRSFPVLKVIPSGGVNLDNFLDYLKAGAVACAIGRSLCDKSLIRAHQWPEITERAKQFIQKLEPAKVAR